MLIYLLVNVPIVFLGLYLYDWSYKKASEDLSNSTVVQLNKYLDDLQREMQWIELQQYHLMKDDQTAQMFITWNTLTNIERKDNYQYLMERISTVANSSQYIKNVNFYIHSISKVVTSTNEVLEMDVGKYEKVKKYAEEQSNQRLKVSNDDIELISIKYSGRKDTEPLYIVEIELDQKYMKQTLEQLKLYQDSHFILYSNSGNFMINSDEPTIRLVDLDIDLSVRTGTVKIHRDHFQFNQAFNEELDVNVITLLPEKTLKKPISFFSKWVWLFLFTSITAIIIIYITSYKLIHQPINRLLISFKEMESGNLGLPIQYNNRDEFSYIYRSYNEMLHKLNAFIERDYVQKMMLQKSELKQLQSQINPHFLYNSFFIVNSLAKVGDTDRIEEFTVMLGEYFRFITRNNGDLVLLSEEVKHSRIYTDIQALRFSRRITVQFDDLPEKICDYKTPRLIIQPIIENAYEHALEKKTEEGMLQVQFHHENEQFFSVIVEDNGDELTDEQIERLQMLVNNPGKNIETTGIINIHRRLQLTYGDGSGLFFKRSELGGLSVEIVIKKQIN